MAGMWTHKDLIEDVFSFDDLLDALEIIHIKSENEKRAEKAAERAAKQRG